MTEAEWQTLVLSCKVGFWAALACLIPGTWLGWVLARSRFFGKPLLEAVVFLPMVLPPVVPGYLLLMTFGQQGPVGQWFYTHWGISWVFDWKGAAMAAAVVALPLMVQSVKLAVMLVDQRYEHLARTLGARPLWVWCSVSLPLMAPGILTGLLLVFIRSLGEFGATITFVGNIPGETRTLALAIYSASQQVQGEASALRLIGLCTALGLLALLLSHYLSQRTARWLGHARA
jgi:molybdate transport system permease protein